MLKAAEFWAGAKRNGLPTAPEAALDADVILAAQAAVLNDTGESGVPYDAGGIFLKCMVHEGERGVIIDRAPLAPASRPAGPTIIRPSARSRVGSGPRLPSAAWTRSARCVLGGAHTTNRPLRRGSRGATAGIFH